MRSLPWRTHQTGLWEAAKSPHLHPVKLEIFLGRQLWTVVGGARGLGLAVSLPEVGSHPKPKVMVLPAHALQSK